jgi:uncharacterized membrane protein
VEQLVGNLLRIGVFIAAVVAILGGIAYLLQHGGTRPDYAIFHGEPAALRSLTGIVTGAIALDRASVVQLGIILLIATPIARVLFTLVAFAVRRDWLYVIVSGIVLVLLGFSLLGG